MGKGAKGKTYETKDIDADVAKFPGVDGNLSPGIMDEANKVYLPLTKEKVSGRVEKIRLEGKVPLQVDTYRLTYMPPRAGRQIAATHPWESKMTMEQVIDKYEPRKPKFKNFKAEEGMITPVLPLPKGTNYLLVYFKPPVIGSKDRSGISATFELHADEVKNIQNKMRTTISTKLIPSLCRGVQRDNASKAGIKTTPSKDANGNIIHLPVLCDEVKSDGNKCGGTFRRDSRGFFVCQNCSILYERAHSVHSNEDDDSDEDGDDSYETYYSRTQDVSDLGDDAEIENQTYVKATEVGGMMDKAIWAIENRLATNYVAWREAISEVPSDEERARKRAEEQTTKHLAAKKYFASLKGHEMYESRWTSRQNAYKRAKALYLIKHEDMTTGELLQALDMASTKKQFYALLSTLEQEGLVREYKVPGIREVYLVYIGPESTRTSRCPKEFVAPVLLQVQYGGYQQKTINARRH